MAEETLSEKLARHCAALQLSQVPASVIASAKLHLLDSLGCLLAGARLEPGRLAYELAVATVGKSGSFAGATLFGTDLRVPFLDAVQAMAVAAHCGEMDDIHAGAGTCIGALIVPALMAMVERDGGSGQRFLEALIVGYETTARVGLAINAPRLFARGWWPSTVCGVFGVTAAGAKWLGWPAEKTANAIGIAALNAGGMITGGNEGATARHLVFGRAAQAGVLALLAAEQGFTGPKRAFEDPRGFCLTLADEPKWNYLAAGERYFLPEVAFKPYPCARQLHAGVEALLRLMQQHSFASSSIEEIELLVPTANAAMMSRPATPRNRAAVLGSGQYVMAITAHRGKMDLVSFAEEFLRSDDVLRLMAKVKVKAAPDLDRHFPKYWPGRVAVLLAEGRNLVQEIIIPKGESGNPMASDELEAKFLDLASPILGETQAHAVMQEVRSLEDRDSVQALISSLTRHASR
jgi:2-methylcitrate dehydratase PrpD